MPVHRLFNRSTAIGLVLALGAAPAFSQGATGVTILSAEEGLVLLDEIIITAAEQLKQAPGVSTISAQDLEKTPPTRDVTETIRKMPGVNLTGNTSSGSRGNQRQIDIRGMGPENTLILIDGKPVMSRNSVRYSHSGERDTRGDASWVLPEEIERIEVIRGPAAARYGSGAAGGVVNIITKRPTEPTYSFGMFYAQPGSDKEGATRRMSFSAAGPLGERFGYRFSLGRSQTDADAADINGDIDPATGAGTAPAGREGVKSTDARLLLSWQLDAQNRFEIEGGWSEQRNIFASDVHHGSSSPGAAIINLHGTETNKMTRRTLSLTHQGDYSFGTWESSIQYEKTHNHRLSEGLSGGQEGTIQTANPVWTDTYLENLFAKSEVNIPLSFGVEQMLTIGVDFRKERLEDPRSIQGSASIDPNSGWGSAGADRDPVVEAWLAGVYVESNMRFGDTLTVTPGVRFDRHSDFGVNASPSLNLTWNVTPQIELKAGIARAFKAPNLYQMAEGYVYSSRGNGCPPGMGNCYVIGNGDLDPERSVNKEIGLAFNGDTGLVLGATWFRNDYENKIKSGDKLYGTYTVPGTTTTRHLFKWENSGKAVIEGIEANFSVPLLGDRLVWSGNYTRMLKSEDENGVQLSLVPAHTLNTSLDWQATDRLALGLSATHYGVIEARNGSTINIGTTANPIIVDAPDRPAYWLANLTLGFDVNAHTKLTAGVNNVFNETLKRTGVGANTFNEAGRSYYFGLTARW